MTPEIRDTKRAAGAGLSARWWLAPLFMVFAIALAPVFVPGPSQAQAAVLVSSSDAAVARGVSASSGADITMFGLGCGAPSLPGASHSGSCAQYCGAGCSLALDEGGRGVPVLPGPSEYPPQESGILGSLDPQPDFRPPRLVR